MSKLVHKHELLLVFDCMPNGSLDKFLYQKSNSSLTWTQRMKIIKDVAFACKAMRLWKGYSQTSHVAGTLSYMPHELARTGKANTSTDIYAFGIFMLEITYRGILAVVDGMLEKRFVVQEAELVLKLGLLCSHPMVVARPNMSRVVSYLDGVASLPGDVNSIIKAREFPRVFDDELISERNNIIPSLTITEKTKMS
ncbi:hypothetical protein GOBAR_AA16244 [Gossypium barbadense]|uniref:Protein kinase domain-containing protein n=1 Tax=Gossypium barbadense TaxID=3634 RepID=A0A2P5XM83_GOSBA|nr:hypothetical protein GOBAR_AA16244 [Gossypium barbadense]